MSDSQGNSSFAGVEQVDRVIHEPARFMLMAQLCAVDEADFVFLVRQTGFSPGNAGSHLNKLVDAGYLSVTKTFVGNRPHTVFATTGEGEKAFRVYCSTMSRLLDLAEASLPKEKSRRRRQTMLSGLPEAPDSV